MSGSPDSPSCFIATQEWRNRADELSWNDQALHDELEATRRLRGAATQALAQDIEQSSGAVLDLVRQLVTSGRADTESVAQELNARLVAAKVSTHRLPVRAWLCVRDSARPPLSSLCNPCPLLPLPTGCSSQAAGCGCCASPRTGQRAATA